ncbi:unnamed protein product [[Candida] boidinii]|nr:unnamed protein product [[Candida] boidinii]
MPEYYTYTSGAGCTSVDGIDDLKDFKETIEAMRTIGLTQDEQDQVFRLLSAILYIGNIRFAEDEEGNSKVQDTSITDFVAYLLSVNPQVLCKSITERIVETNHVQMFKLKNQLVSWISMVLKSLTIIHLNNYVLIMSMKNYNKFSLH